MKARNILGALALLLALLLAFSVYWGFGQKGEKDTILKEKAIADAEIEDLKGLKAELQLEVDSLEQAYNVLTDENQSLQEDLKNEKARVQRRNVSLKQTKGELAAVQQKSATDAAELSSLRGQIQSLLTAKASLESSISRLQSQNDSLMARTGVLEENLGKSRKDNMALADMNRSIQEEVGRLTLANFKATAFNVEVRKRNNEKVTAKSRKARRIDVSFDLTNVPEKYQGVRPIYMVITDSKAVPIQLTKAIKTTVKVNGQETEILAAESKEINIAKNQRLSFKHDLESKLKSGYYRVSVYTDIGLLGSSSMRLR